MIWIKAYFGVLISFLVIDLAWIATFVRGYYQKEVGELMLDAPNGVAAGLFYLAYAAGIVLLAVRPALAEGSVTTALINGAVIGALAYGTYTITNYAILKGWTTGLVVSDIAWGAFLTAVVAACGYFAARL